MDTGVLYQQVIEAAAAVLIILTTWGIAELRRYVSNRVTNEDLKASVNMTAKVIGNSVKASISNLSTEAKLAVADGKVTKEELDVIEVAAFRHYDKQVAPKLQKRLEAHVDDTQQFIVNMIQAELQKAEKVTG